MGAHGRGGEHEPLRDLPRGEPAPEQRDDLPLAARQPLGAVAEVDAAPARRRVAELLEHASRERPRQRGLAGQHVADRERYPGRLHVLQQIAVGPGAEGAEEVGVSLEMESMMIRVPGQRAAISHTAAIPLPGMRTSSRQMSGCSAIAASTALGASAGLGDDHHLGVGLDGLADVGSGRCVIVCEKDADLRHSRTTSISVPRPGPRRDPEVGPERQRQVLHAAEPEPGAAVHRLGRVESGAVVGDLRAGCCGRRAAPRGSPRRARGGPRS